MNAEQWFAVVWVLGLWLLVGAWAYVDAKARWTRTSATRLHDLRNEGLR